MAKGTIIIIMRLCRSINVPYASRYLQIFSPEKGHHAKRMINIRDRTYFLHAANVEFFVYVMNLLHLPKKHWALIPVGVRIQDQMAHCFSWNFNHFIY